MSNFLNAIKNHKNGNFVIAEIKLSSPQEGALGKKSQLLKRAKDYEKAGAGAISVVTEKNLFNGDPVFVKKIKQKISLPVLQKEFVLDATQIFRAKEMGADAILLIAKFLSLGKLQNFVDRTLKLNIEPVVEINDVRDLKKAKNTKTRIIAVNARNLKTFEVDVDKACILLKKVPEKFIKLGFSGIKSTSEIEKYKKEGAKGVLVGTALMKSKNVKKFLESLIYESVKVKICGVRNIKAAKAAVKAGVDFLGFNFVAASPRFIKPDLALKIVNKLKGKVKTVGVFQNSSKEYVNKVVSDLNLDFVQLHGNENNSYISKIKKPVIKSINLGTQKIKADYLILDRSKQGKGRMINLKKAGRIRAKFPIFFAGGLNPQNVAEAVRKVRPYAVDVAGGIETNKEQDLNKIKRFIQNAKGALI